MSASATQGGHKKSLINNPLGENCGFFHWPW